MTSSLESSIVRIRTADGASVGAGFLVGARQIVTCAHVVAAALAIRDDTPEKPQAPVYLDFPRVASGHLLTTHIVLWHPPQPDNSGDIAGLELVEDPPLGAQAARLAQVENLWDHFFRAFGFPRGQETGVWGSGRLLSRQATNWIQIEDVKETGYPIEQGFSGTPVWDTQLEAVVGMVVGAERRINLKTAFAIPVDALVSVWPELVPPRNPYKGLQAFTEQDKRDFFGRNDLTNKLATEVESVLTRERKGQHARLLAVIGASGSGKSSVIMAGLLPRLRNGGVLNSNEWIYLDPIVPGNHPLETLALSLTKQMPTRTVVDIHQNLSASPRNLHLLASELKKSAQQKVVLIVDQFEEVFTITPEEERQHFFDHLVAAATEPHGPLMVILTLRADFYDRPMHYRELYQLIDDHHVSVLPMGTDNLREVIEEPARLPDVRLTFEERLVDELILDMQGQCGALPLLQFTLDQLVQRQGGRLLTLQMYREIGGVKGALSRHADETYKELLSDEQRQMARDLFLRLIEPGDIEQEATRRRAPLAEFQQDNREKNQRMEDILDAFTNARLLVRGNTTVEVSHEALIHEWKQLAQWLNAARKDILFQQSLSETVEEWERQNQSKDLLYRGTQLKKAQKWASHNQPSEREATFLRASEESKRKQIFFYIAIPLLFLLILLSISSVLINLMHPDTTRVTKLDDNVPGSLRYCIDNASSGSTITFDPGLRGRTISLKGDLSFASDKQLKIIGLGANSIIISNIDKNGNYINAAIHVFRDAKLTISGLSFKNSRTTLGAFIHNQGMLTVTDSTISDNQDGTSINAYNPAGIGGGIFNDNTGVLKLVDSTISNNRTNSMFTSMGGGIYNAGRLQVIHSKISHNTTRSGASLGYGGGIYNDSQGVLTMTDSTVIDNIADSGFMGQGGGIANNGIITISSSTISSNEALNHNSQGQGYSYGGGIVNGQGGKLVVINSTISNNSAQGTSNTGGGGGIASGGGDASTELLFDTIAYNTADGGGGIQTDSTGNNHLTMSNSIMAANSAQQDPDISGVLTSGGYNLIEHFTEGQGLNPTTDKQVAFADLKIDSTLHANGGPTQTLALLPGSSAINKIPAQACRIIIQDATGHPVTITTDERGKPRANGSKQTCDVGAYELSS